MAVLFDGSMRVEAGFLNLISVGSNDFDENDVPGHAESFSGQHNGLCGAAAPGALFLVTGVIYGPTEIRVELHDVIPLLGQEWDDAVEVSFEVRPGPVILRNIDDDRILLDIPPGEYRVRYAIQKMQNGRNAGTTSTPEDRCIVQLWKAPRQTDTILRVGSHVARGHHEMQH